MTWVWLSKRNTKNNWECKKILGKITQSLKGYEGLDEDEIIEKWFSKESLENGIIKMEDLISNLNLDNPYRETFEKDLQDKINMSKLQKEVNSYTKV